MRGEKINDKIYFMFDVMCILCRLCCILPHGVQFTMHSALGNHKVLPWTHIFPFFHIRNVPSLTTFSHLSDTFLLDSVCVFFGVLMLFSESICGNGLTTVDWNRNERREKMFQCNKYNMTASNYTEADSPTNLTINNVCAFFSLHRIELERCVCVSVFGIRIATIKS